LACVVVIKALSTVVLRFLREFVTLLNRSPAPSFREPPGFSSSVCFIGKRRTLPRGCFLLNGAIRVWKRWILACHSGLRSHRLPTSFLAFQLLHELDQSPPELVFGKMNRLTGFHLVPTPLIFFIDIGRTSSEVPAVLGKSPAAFVLTRIEQILEAIRQPCTIVQSGMTS
jgi:hypothetical protein